MASFAEVVPPRPASVDTSAELARPSSYTSRPARLGVQTRMRARSVNSGSAAPSPVTAGQPYMSPTLAGSPVPPTIDNFDLVRQATGSAPGHQRTSEDDGVPSLEDEHGSTESETPPTTPVHSPRGQPTIRKTGDWVQDGTKAAPQQQAKRSQQIMPPSLKESTRHNLRRGRSFTSLLVQPTTPSPAFERPDPIAELHEPKSPSPPLDIESGEAQPLAYGASTFPPAAAPVTAVARPVKSLRDFVPQVALLSALFVGSFAVIAVLISTLPNLFIPHAVSDLPALTSALSTYRASSSFAELHLFVVLTVLFLWKQCFSIPGSVLTNILFGALYGTAAGTWWACIWTALGSTGAYGIALVISPLVEYYFATPLDVTRRALKLPHPDMTQHAASNVVPLSTGDLFSHLLLARFFPLLPYSVLNVISGVLRLPVSVFFITLVLGSFPFNFVTVSIGQLVAIAASDPSTPLSNKIWSGAVLAKLATVTIVSVVPLIFKKQLQAFLSSPALASAFQGLPTQAKFVLDRTRDAVVRKIFGFGIITRNAVPSGAMTSTTAPSESSAQRERSKWSRAWGGNDDELEQTRFGSEVKRSIMNRWDGDEGDALALREEEGVDENGALLA